MKIKESKKIKTYRNSFLKSCVDMTHEQFMAGYPLTLFLHVTLKLRYLFKFPCNSDGYNTVKWCWHESCQNMSFKGYDREVETYLEFIYFIMFFYPFFIPRSDPRSDSRSSPLSIRDTVRDPIRVVSTPKQMFSLWRDYCKWVQTVNFSLHTLLKTVRNKGLKIYAF